MPAPSFRRPPGLANTFTSQSQLKLTVQNQIQYNIQFDIIYQLRSCARASSRFCAGPCRVAAACAAKPSQATIASRPFLISRTRMRSYRSGSAARFRGSNSQPPGRGRGEGRGRAVGGHEQQQQQARRSGMCLQPSAPQKTKLRVPLTWIILVSRQVHAKWLKRSNAAGTSILWPKHEQHLGRRGDQQ